MTVYVDGLLFLNFFFDFILLAATSIALKRNISMFRIILGAFIGSISILVLFFKVNSIELFIIKIYLGFLMCVVTFGFKNVRSFLKIQGTFYIISILLGGFLYFINLEFSYKHDGLIFFHKNVSPNIIFLCIISPIILYIYIRQVKMYKCKISKSYKVNLYIGKRIIKLDGFLDTGNSLTFKNRPVMICNLKNKFKKKKYYIMAKTVSGNSLIECINIKKVLIEGLGVYENVYLGFNSKLKFDGFDILLNSKMEE